MISAIVVEDEDMIRNGIRKHVNWKQLGIEEIRTAENAEETFRICKNFHPDIIISDIRMPGNNGIILCTELHNRFPESQIIFISGFSDKEYLKAAISLGAVRYVEKPIDIEELSDAIKQAVNAVITINCQSGNALHSLLKMQDREIGDERQDIQVLNFFQHGRELRSDHIFIVCILQADRNLNDVIEFQCKVREELFRNLPGYNMHFIADVLNEDTFIMMVSMQDKIEKIETMEKEIGKIVLSLRGEDAKWFIAMGKPTGSIGQLKESYCAAQEALKTLSYKGWNICTCNEERVREYKLEIPGGQQNEFFHDLVSRDKVKAEEFVEAIVKKMIQNHSELSFYIKELFYSLNLTIDQADKALHFGKNISDVSQVGQFIESVRTISEIGNYLIQHIEDILCDENEGEKNSILLYQVREIIEKNYTNKNLSIQMIADQAYISATYLSNMFKKKTGQTVGQYLADLRIQKAQELLKNPQHKLYQIADMVGYEDPNYFAKIFKKKNGILPSEYRENVLL